MDSFAKSAVLGMTDPETDLERVTIGLPVYNGAGTLDGVIQSLSAQDHPNLVILVSDNASTDETPAILQQWAERDSRVVVFRQPENIGAARNFDWVLRNATTEWFMFAAHDDEWSSNYVSALLACARSVPGCQLAVPKVVFTFPDERVPIVRQLDEQVFDLRGLRKTRSLIREAHGSWIYGVYRRKHLVDVFDASASYPHTWALDLLLLLPSLLRGDVAGTNQAVFTHFETTLSRERYRPKTSSEQFILGRDFRATAIRMLRKEVAGWRNVLRLLLPVLRYADRHGFKFRRAVKSRLKELCCAPRRTPKSAD